MFTITSNRTHWTFYTLDEALKFGARLLNGLVDKPKLFHEGEFWGHLALCENTHSVFIED